MVFQNLYNNENGKIRKNIKIANGSVYVYERATKKKPKGTWELVDEKAIQCKKLIVEPLLFGENILKSKEDLIKYGTAIQQMCAFLGIEFKEHLDCMEPFQMIRLLVQRSIPEIKVEDPSILEIIDEATGGGCLVTKAGKHEGQFASYDINSSYNKIFVDYDFPTNPHRQTVTKINKSATFALYRLKIEAKFLTKENKDKYKLTRRWFTKCDINLFRKCGIDFELVQEENNCVMFDKVESDFSWLEKLNAIKNKTPCPITKTTLKLILSRVWGIICAFDKVEESDEEIAAKYYHSMNPTTCTKIFKNPICIFKYQAAIIKPFVLAYGRSRILQQIKTCEDAGYAVLYSHTDSIITSAPKELFEIGKGIGQWKIDRQTQTGIEIKNIGCKIWLD